MKKLLNIILALGTLLVALPLIAQEEEKPELSLNLRYFNRNGSLQYMKIKAMIRENKKLQPVSEANIQVFLNETSAENLIAKIKTDENGEAKFTIPVSMKE